MVLLRLSPIAAIVSLSSANAFYETQLRRRSTLLFFFLLTLLVPTEKHSGMVAGRLTSFYNLYYWLLLPFPYRILISICNFPRIPRKIGQLPERYFSPPCLHVTFPRALLPAFSWAACSHAANLSLQTLTTLFIPLLQNTITLMHQNVTGAHTVFETNFREDNLVQILHNGYVHHTVENARRKGVQKTKGLQELTVQWRYDGKPFNESEMTLIESSPLLPLVYEDVVPGKTRFERHLKPWFLLANPKKNIAETLISVSIGIKFFNCVGHY